MFVTAVPCQKSTRPGNRRTLYQTEDKPVHPLHAYPLVRRRVRHGSGVWPTVGRIRCSSDSVLPVAGWKFPAGFLGKVAFDYRIQNLFLICISHTDDFPETDCAMADSGAANMNDLIFRRLSLSPEECAGGRNTAADVMKFAVMIFRRTKLPANEFSAGQNGGYIWHDLGTEPSVCNRPVTGSHGFGSSHRLEQCCLWFAALNVHRIENAEIPLSNHLLLVVLFHMNLRDAFKARHYFRHASD